MPSVVVDVFVRAAFFVAKAFAGGYGATVAFLSRVAGVVLLEQITSKLFGPKMPSGAGLTAPQVMSRTAMDFRKVVYGQALVSGPVVYNNLSGNEGQYLWFVIALAHGESESIEELWFDGDKILKSEIDWTAGTGGADGTGTGIISASRWVGEEVLGIPKKAAYAWYYLGHADQVAATILTSSFAHFGTDSRGRGITYVVTRFEYAASTEGVWKEGIPQNIKALVKGRKVYDPRKDSTEVIDNSTSPLTYGSGTHRYTDSTTWEWSDNPALCVADYLVNIMGADAATSIDWTTIADTADDCDVSVDVAPAASPTNTQTRFTCNGAISLGVSHKDNLDSLVSSCAGKLSYSAGVWKLRASVWEASSLSIDADDLAGDVEVRGSAPKSERFNLVRGFFVDPDRKYEGAEFPHVSASEYLTRDAGQVISYDLQLPCTNNQYMAQRIAYRLLEHGDNQIVCSLTMNERGAKVCVGDVVDVTLDDFSWSAKTFRCIDWSRNSDGTYKVTLREDNSGDYTDPLVSEYKTVNSTESTIPSDVVPAPTDLAAAQVSSGIRLTWTTPASRVFEYIDVYESATSAWGGASLVASVRGDQIDLMYPASTTRYYWIRARNFDGEESDREPDSDTSTVTATSAAGPGGATGAAAVFVNQYIRSSGTPATPGTTSASYDFDTATFTPTSTWSEGVPAQTSPTTPVWVSTAQFYSSDSSGTDSSTTWSTPQKLAEDGESGSPGDAGSDGSATAFINQYIRNSGAPATPGTTSASYNFDTATFTPTSTWSEGVPDQTSPETPVWVSTAQFYTADGTGTDSSTTWTTPAKLAEDGAAGADGAAGSDGADSVTVNYTNNSHAVPVDNGGTETWTGSGGLFYAYEGSTVLTLDTNTQGTAYPVTPGEYRLDITKVSGDTLTEPAITGQTTTTATIAAWAGDLTTATVYRITAYILTSDSTQVSLSTDVTLSPSDQGSDGAAGDPGAAGADGDDAFAMNYTNNSHAVPVTNTGTETWTGSGGKCYIFEGSTLLTLNTNTQTGSYAGLSNGEYNLNITAVSGDTLTEPAITGQTTTTATVADWAGDLTQATVYQLDAYVQGSAGSQVTITEYITLSPSDQGADGSVGTDAVTINYTNSSHAVPVTNLGVETWTSSGGKCYIFEGATVLTLKTDTQTGSYYDLSNGEYNLNITKVSGNTLTEPAITGQTTTTATIANWAGNLTGVTVYKLDAYVQNSNGDQITLTEYITLSPANQGADGADGTDGTDGEDLTSDITAIGGNIIDFQSSPTDAAVGFKVDNNGNVYSYNNNLKVYSSLGTWLNTGSAGDYDVGLFKDAGTHDTPSGSSIDTWLDAGTDRAWTFEETGSGTYSLDGEIKWRNGTTFEVLGSASVNLSVSVI